MMSINQNMKQQLIDSIKEYISQLSSNEYYNIYSIKQVETTYGTSYILEDNDFNKYWSNNTVNKFIKFHKIKEGDGSKLLFKIKTGSEKQFNKGDDTIKFVETRCFLANK